MEARVIGSQWLPLWVITIIALVIVSPAHADARKCSRTRNGLPVDVSKPLLVVDGEIVGDLPTEPAGQIAYTDHRGRTITAEDILRIDIVCLEVGEADRKVGRAAIAMTTKDGAIAFMRSHLESLVAVQEEYRTANGRYAMNLDDLDFFTTRAPLPITLTTDEAGWAATVELSPLTTTCSAGSKGPSGGWVRCDSA